MKLSQSVHESVFQSVPGFSHVRVCGVCVCACMYTCKSPGLIYGWCTWDPCVYGLHKGDIPSVSIHYLCTKHKYISHLSHTTIIVAILTHSTICTVILTGHSSKHTWHKTLVLKIKVIKQCTYAPWMPSANIRDTYPVIVASMIL